MQEGQWNAQPHAFVNPISQRAAHKDRGQRGQLKQIGPGHFPAIVARCHVSNLMRHDAGHFGFFVRGQNQPGVHVEESAGQGHRVDHVGINDLDGERHLRVRVANQILSDAVHVLGNDGIVDQFDLGLDLLGILAPARDLSLNGVPVAYAASATHVAVPDCIYVGLAAVMLDLAVILGRQGGRLLLGGILHVPSLGLTRVRIVSRRLGLR